MNSALYEGTLRHRRRGPRPHRFDYALTLLYLDLAYQGAPAFKAELDMPVYKCTGCGKEQLRSTKELQGHTAQAIAALNDAAGFPHSG